MTDTAWVSDLDLSDSERSMITALVLDPDAEIQVLSGLSADELWNAIECSAKVYTEYKRAQVQLKTVIGKLLIAIESYPEVYQSRGYRTYDDFITRGCREIFHLPRSEAYRGKRLASAWPNLSPSEVSEIGEGHLYVLSGFTSAADPASAGWLDVARNSTLDQLKDRIVQSGEATTEDITMVQISFTTTLEVKKSWLAFVANPQVQATVGSDNPGKILVAAIGEFLSAYGHD
jgi:hypothetical protein